MNALAEVTTLSGMLLARAGGSHRDDEAIVYRERNRVTGAASGRELLGQAQRVAAVLRRNGVSPGDRVLIMLFSPREFLEAFFGAVWADTIPVPIAPPLTAADLDGLGARLSNIAGDAGACLLLSSADPGRGVQCASAGLVPGLRTITPASWACARERLTTEPGRGAGDLAFLQYTSGSTGDPKGVAITHANVIANLRAIGGALRLDANDVGVSWLPMHHDMGLIGTLCMLFAGGKLVSLTPREFAMNPASWLRAISEHKATLSAAPNFAYRRCLSLRANNMASLDLSNWRVALSGAEPVDAHTLGAFASQFEPAGLRPTALLPVYGLAEHTLAVSFPPLGHPPRVDYVYRPRLASRAVAETVRAFHPDATPVVSVGRALPGVTIEIRDAGDRALPDGFIGEVVVKSASVMAGYYRRPGATAEVLRDGWLNTGDLGYVKQGLLYITGRQKDIVIRSGRNYYPQDIEDAAAAVEGVRAGRVIAFSVPSRENSDDIVVLAETHRRNQTTDRKLIHDIACSVAARIGCRPDRVALLPRRALPITTSGKPRRAAAREQFLAGRLPRAGHSRLDEPRSLSDLGCSTAEKLPTAELRSLEILDSRLRGNDGPNERRFCHSAAFPRDEPLSPTGSEWHVELTWVIERLFQMGEGSGLYRNRSS